MSGPQAVVAIPLWLAVPFYMLYAAVWLAAIVVAGGVVLVILLWHEVASFVCSTPSLPRSRDRWTRTRKTRSK